MNIKGKSALADSWLLWAGTARKLAVMLAVSWLLFDNSQPGRNHLKGSQKPRFEIQHNSQQII
ncbi:hypothetical protein ABC974_07305 [Sphingomonas oligophenolica]|uniref:Uncharacterized protein n=1 Tax=Sphingomonas oligophenolica TaxID=301154 RepID=A0ABU9Y0Z0_9SPHN